MSISEFKLDPSKAPIYSVNFVIDCTQSICFVARQLGKLILVWANEFPVLASFPKFDSLVCLRLEFNDKRFKLHFMEIKVCITILVDLCKEVEHLILVTQERKYHSGGMETVQAREWYLDFCVPKVILLVLLFG